MPPGECPGCGGHEGHISDGNQIVVPPVISAGGVGSAPNIFTRTRAVDQIGRIRFMDNDLRFRDILHSLLPITWSHVSEYSRYT